MSTPDATASACRPSSTAPEGIAYPIPGNDDAMRAIHLYCELVSGAVLDGLQAEAVASGVDIGSAEEVSEDLPAATHGDALGSDAEAQPEA